MKETQLSILKLIIDNYFLQIITSQNLKDEKKAINDVIELCISANIAVCVITKIDNTVYYKSMTIKKHLELLKKKKKNPYKIDYFDTDYSTGKIKKIILIEK